MDLPSLRAAGLALCLLPSCETVSEGVTVSAGGTRPYVVLDSDPVAGGGTLVASWEQTFIAGGAADAYLYPPGDSASACHLTSGIAGIDFHCEGHAGTIVVNGIDPLRPHVVAVTLLRNQDTTALKVTQDGMAAPQSCARVPGTPDVAEGGRVRLQVAVRGGAEISIAGFEVRSVN